MSISTLGRVNVRQSLVRLCHWLKRCGFGFVHDGSNLPSALPGSHRVVDEDLQRARLEVSPLEAVDVRGTPRLDEAL